MSEFIRKYEDLRESSVEYITNFLKENGGQFDFVSQEELDSEDFYEYAYELPQAYIVNKYETYCQYAITSVTLEKDNIWLNGVDLSECGDDYHFGVYEVDVACLCDCADSLIIKEK
jgi:hypothetical protein